MIMKQGSRNILSNFFFILHHQNSASVASFFYHLHNHLGLSICYLSDFSLLFRINNGEKNAKMFLTHNVGGGCDIKIAVNMIHLRIIKVSG